MATMKEVSSKLDKVMDVQIQQAGTLGRLTSSVEEHVKRSNIAEQRQNEIESRQEKFEKKIDKHISMVQGAGMLLGFLATLATILEGIHYLFNK